MIEDDAVAAAKDEIKEGLLAVTAAEDALRWARIRMQNADEMLASDTAPELPVISIADAEPVKAGQVAEFMVSLSKPSSGSQISFKTTYTFPSGLSGTAFIPMPAGDTSMVLPVPVGAQEGSLRVGISNPEGATLGRSVATCTVLPADDGDPSAPLFMIEETITTPLTIPAGSWADLRCVAMVARYAPASPARHQKFIGAASSQSAGQGAFCIGMSPQDRLDVWRAGGGGANTLPAPPPMPKNQATLVLWWFDDTSHSIEIDGITATGNVATPMAAIDGVGAVGAGYWKGTQVDPLAQGSEIRAIAGFRAKPSAAELGALKEKWAHMIETSPGNGGGNGGGGGGEGLEPVNSSALAVSIDVGTAPRQTFVGFGMGIGGHGNGASLLDRYERNAGKVFDTLFCRVIRLHNTLDTSSYVSSYRGVANLAASRGCSVLSTEYMYRGGSNPAGLARAANSALDAGVPITHLSIQNEPDGNPGNKMTGDVIAHHRELREKLSAPIKLIAPEWRHPENGRPEHDAFLRAGFFPATISAGALHIYNKGPMPEDYDDRYMKSGLGMWSCETGDGSSPKTQAQFLVGLLHGVVAEIFHIGIADSSASSDSDMRQKLMDVNGVFQPYAHALGLIARTIVPGTVMRGSSSSDRPGGMSDRQAKLMIWHSGLSQRQPRQYVVVGRRPDGRHVLAAVNYAFGTDSPTAFSGGHYAAAQQQITVRVAELAGKGGELVGRLCSMGGNLGPERAWAVSDGHVRFTLAPGETIAGEMRV